MADKKGKRSWRKQSWGESAHRRNRDMIWTRLWWSGSEGNKKMKGTRKLREWREQENKGSNKMKGTRKWPEQENEGKWREHENKGNNKLKGTKNGDKIMKGVANWRERENKGNNKLKGTKNGDKKMKGRTTNWREQKLKVTKEKTGTVMKGTLPCRKKEMKGTEPWRWTRQWKDTQGEGCEENE